MHLTGRRTRIALVCLFSVPAAAAQQPPVPAALVTTGQVTVDGHVSSYLIRRLPVSSFPDLPDAIAGALNQRGCLIPQTYQAHHPENVVHASLEHAGSSDWAVLCAARGSVSLLVFFGSDGATPIVLASVPETQRLQVHDATGVLGFDWGIDPATAQAVRLAQTGPERTPLLDHDALADSVIDHRTLYHVYARSNWSVVTTDD